MVLLNFVVLLPLAGLLLGIMFGLIGEISREVKTRSVAIAAFASVLIT